MPMASTRSRSSTVPSSLLATHFDIDGLPDIEGHPNLKQSWLMFQKLLFSRFKLAFHNESRELPAYAIQIAKSGPKLALTKRKTGDSTNFSYNCQVVLTARNASVDFPSLPSLRQRRLTLRGTSNPGDMGCAANYVLSAGAANKNRRERLRPGWSCRFRELICCLKSMNSQRVEIRSWVSLMGRGEEVGARW
jgi:hypothetical protein